MKTIKEKFLPYLKNNKIYLLVWTMIFCNPMIVTAYADEVDFKKLKIFTGTVDLLSAGANALLAIVVLVTAVLCLIKGIQWMTADEQEKPQKKKAILDVLKAGIFVACVMGIVSVCLKAYGLKDETGKVKEAMAYLINCRRFI